MKLNLAGEITEKTLNQAFDFWRHKIPGEDTISVAFLSSGMVKEWQVDVDRVGKVIDGMLNPVNGEVTKEVFIKFCMALGPWDKIFKNIDDQFWDPRTNDIIAWFHGEVTKTNLLQAHGQYILRYAPQRAGLNLTVAKGELGKQGVIVKNHLITNNCRGGWVTENSTNSYFSLQEFYQRNNLCEDLCEPVIRGGIIIGLNNQSDHTVVVQCTSAHKFESWQQKEVPAKSISLLQGWPGRQFTVQLFNQTAGSFTCGTKATGLTLAQDLRLSADNIAFLFEFKSTLTRNRNDDDAGFEVVDEVKAVQGYLADLKSEDPRVLLELAARDLQIKNLSIQLTQMTALLADAQGGSAVKAPAAISTIRETFTLLRSLEARLLAGEPQEETTTFVYPGSGGDGHSLPDRYFSYPSHVHDNQVGVMPSEWSGPSQGKIIEALSCKDVINWLRHLDQNNVQSALTTEIVRNIEDEDIDGTALMALTDRDFKNLGFQDNQIQVIRQQLKR